MSDDVKAVVLTCMDYRFVKPLAAILEAEGAGGRVDLIAWPGGAASLTMAGGEPVVDAIALAIRLHQPDEIVLAVHEDCKRFGGSAAFESPAAERAEMDRLLADAMKLVTERFPDVPARTLALDLSIVTNP